MLKNIIVSLIVGILGGMVAFSASLVLEVLMNMASHSAFTSEKEPLFLLALLVSAFLEEISKITVSAKVLRNFRSRWAIPGTALGFGLLEAFLAQAKTTATLSPALLPFAHIFFLTAGYWVAKCLVKEKKWFYLLWLATSALLHFGYNTAITFFLLKP